MRRAARRKEEENAKSIVYLSGIILGIIVVAFITVFVLYNMRQNTENGTLTTEKISELVPNSTNESKTETASTDLSKSVEESQNELENNSVFGDEVNTNITNETAVNVGEQVNSNTVQDTNTTDTTTQQKPKELAFTSPVEGEVIKRYSKDTVVYSETLKEWTTHLGVDIRAEKATVVKAAEDGKVISIKNDPRYGLTIIIEHSGDFKTLYASLLTTEFVKVGEEVTKGQTIATVGNSAIFEIADDTHLHFEMLKDNQNVDPEIYISL